MKKVLKIALISILSLIAVVLVAASVLIWIVFTPEKLTPIVRNQMDKMLVCEHQIDNVELTFFSTFPSFGIQIDHFLLKNQLEGSPSDTVVYADKLQASLDINALVKNNELLIEKLKLDNAFVLAFTDSLGNANYDIFKSDDVEDTTSFQLPFNYLLLDKIELKNSQIVYHDSPMDMIISLNDFNANLDMKWQGDDINGKIKASIADFSFYWDETDYLQSTHLEVNTPFSFNIQDFILELKTADLTLADLPLKLDAFIHNRSVEDDMLLDIVINSDGELPVPAVFELMSLPFGEYIEGMTVDGKSLLKATLKGAIADSLMPVFALQADFNQVKFEYESLPYKLIDMSGIADIEMDLNDDSKWFVHVSNFFGRTGQSNFAGGAFVDQLTTDMRFDVKAKANLNLVDAKPVLPDDMLLDVKGLASGDISIKFLYSDLEHDRYDKFLIDGKFKVKNLVANYDTISIRSQLADLAVKIPNKKNPKTSFVELDILTAKLDAAMGSTTKAALEDLNLLLSVSNIMDDNLPLSAAGKFSGTQVAANMDDMTAYLSNPAGNFNLTMDMQDSTAIPYLDCKFTMHELKASTDSLEIDILKPDGKIIYKADAANPKIPYVQLVYASDKLKAAMGETLIHTKNISVDAGVSYDETQDNFLLQWIPKGYVVMADAKIQEPSIDADIQIPSINFDFTPDELLIRDSQLKIDQSDFQLTGKLTNVQEYIRNEGLLKGDFNFRSHKTDVNKLMSLFSGMGYSEEELVDNEGATPEQVAQESTTSSGPFMVPKGIDISLYTSISEAYVQKDTARNVQGTVTVKDGIMVLESMLFTTSAAKMQLTAMYKTPRKNHLFMGLDFHLLEIEIAELLELIPDVDSIMPMLRSFSGKGEFHLAVETNTDSLYNLKKSTIRGAASVRGIDLVLMDGETFTEIAKTLRFNKKTENKIDSLTAEFTVFRNEVDVYPFIIVMDKYKAIVEGRHNLDMNFNYHISLIDSPLPLKLGVNVIGNLDDMKIRLAKPKYSNLYRPAYRNETETRKLELRNIIRQALVSNVKEE